MFSDNFPGSGSTNRSSSSSQLSNAASNSNSNGAGNEGLYRSRSVSNARQTNTQTADALVSDPAVDGGSGLAARFNFNCLGFESLDRLFGRGWSLDGSTGFISVSDASFLRITNPDPLEKWYIIDPEPISRCVPINMLY